MVFTAQEDCTIVSVFVEHAISLEPNSPTLGSETSNLAGFVALLVNPSGNAIPTLLPSQDWSTTTTADTVNDADFGDIWAWTPLVGSSGGAVNTPYHGTQFKGTLAPRTKRKLRRGDTLSVMVHLSNGAINNAIVQHVTLGFLLQQT